MAPGARSMYLRRYLNVLDARSRDFMWERLIFLQIMLAGVGWCLALVLLARNRIVHVPEAQNIAIYCKECSPCEHTNLTTHLNNIARFITKYISQTSRLPRISCEYLCGMQTLL